jgi:hypothetical protein
LKQRAATNGGDGGSPAEMATLSHSPPIRAADSATPVHSPHHSVHSSSSSRLSARNLTLHEYRKQQNSPAPQATPPGRTLRRKAAAPGLKEIERVPSVSRTPLSSSRVPPRPLHISHSVRESIAILAFLTIPSLHTSKSQVLAAYAAVEISTDVAPDTLFVYVPTAPAISSAPGRLGCRRSLSVAVRGPERAKHRSFENT